MPKIPMVLVKKVIYQFMAAGPILLLGVIAVNSRVKEGTWQFIEYGPETSARLYAYIDPIKDVRERFVYKDEYDAYDVHASVDLWLEGYRNGELKDIYPATTVFEGSSGVYQQVVSARHKLIYRAREQAEAYIEQGEYEKAADLYADVLEVANIAKFGEFSILAESASAQTDVLLRLIEISPYLSEEQRADITDRINGLDDPTRSLTHIVNRISVAYRADLGRKRRSTAVFEVARANHKLASNSDTDDIRIEEWEALSNADQALMPLYTRSRMAQINQNKFIVARDKVLVALEPAEPIQS